MNDIDYYLLMDKLHRLSARICADLGIDALGFTRYDDDIILIEAGRYGKSQYPMAFAQLDDDKLIINLVMSIKHNARLQAKFESWRRDSNDETD
jgi:hypothetical protein